MLAVLISLFAWSACHAFPSGKWISNRSEDGFEGELEIRRDGCCDYIISRIEFGKRVPEGYLDDGCGIEGGDGEVVAKGKRLEVYSHGLLGFTVIQHPDYVQVIPNLTVNDLTCRKTGIPEWVRTFPNRTAIQREIADLKWKKVETFNPQP